LVSSRVLAPLLVLSVLIVAAVIVVAAHSNSAASAGEATSPDALPSVSSGVLEPVTEFEVPTTHTGVLRARESGTLSFEPSGRVAEIHVQEGERVEQGQALAVIDRRRLEGQQREIEGEIETAEAALDLARQEERRQRDLKADGASTERELDQAESERRRLEGQLNSLTGRSAVIAANLEDAVLRAPYDGVVVERMIERGASVSAGTAAFRVMNPETLEARIGVPERYVRDWSEGDRVQLRVAGESVEGQVLQWLPEVDPQRRTRTLRVALAESGHGYAPGQMVRLEQVQRLEEPGFVVPEQALTGSRSGLWALLILEPRPEQDDVWTVRRADVEWLHSTSDQALVRGTVESGTRFVDRGVQRVVPGQRVRLSGGEDSR